MTVQKPGGFIATKETWAEIHADIANRKKKSSEGDKSFAAPADRMMRSGVDYPTKGKRKKSPKR